MGMVGHCDGYHFLLISEADPIMMPPPSFNILISAAFPRNHFMSAGEIRIYRTNRFPLVRSDMAPRQQRSRLIPVHRDQVWLMSLAGFRWFASAPPITCEPWMRRRAKYRYRALPLLSTTTLANFLAFQIPIDTEETPRGSILPVRIISQALKRPDLMCSGFCLGP